MTVDTSGSIDLAGEHLARFLTYLHTDKGVNEVDLVGHSMGGLYARSAIRALATTDSPVKVRSLVTVGTPWQGSYLADFANGTVPLADCAGDQFCENQMRGYVKDVAQVYPSGSAHELGANFLTGPKGWNQFQAGVLDGIPVTLIGGNHFTRQGAPELVWPNDGIVALRSALAVDIRRPGASAPAVLHLRRHPQRLRLDDRESAERDGADLGSGGARRGERGYRERAAGARRSQPRGLPGLGTELDGHRCVVRPAQRVGGRLLDPAGDRAGRQASLARW